MPNKSILFFSLIISCSISIHKINESALVNLVAILTTIFYKSNVNYIFSDRSRGFKGRDRNPMQLRCCSRQLPHHHRVAFEKNQN